jgi:transcriptional regulator with XRE-family HTH domain
VKRETLGERLAQLRREKAAAERRDIDQAEIAKAIGIGAKRQNYVSRWENDVIPKDDIIVKLAAYYGVDPGWLRMGTGQKYPGPAEIRIPDPTKAAVPASGVKKRAGGR